MAQGTYDTLMAVLCALILLLGIPVVTKTWPRIWRGDDDHFRITYTHGNWLWGKVTWRATVRASVLIIAGVPMFGAMGIAVFLKNKPLAIVGLIGWCIWGLLILAVALFNRPRFLVPPYLRSHPGLIREVLDRVRGKS